MHREITSGCSNYTAMLSDFDSDTKPIILLCGWAGAQDRFLRKYAVFLADNGYSTIRSVLPMSALFAPVHLPRRRWATSMLEFARKQSFFPNRSLVFWSFSNGGGFVLEQFITLSTSAPYTALPHLTLAFIFDSAPAYYDDPGLAKKVADAAAPPGVYGTLTKLALRSYASLTPWFLPNRPVDYWQAMKELDWGRPQLFLYSQDDPLCNAEKLIQLIQDKKSRGQRVTSRCWEVSEHCGHFVQHREEYASEVLSFLAQLHGQLGPYAARL